MEVHGPTEPPDQPPAQRKSESIDPSKLTVRQIFESMTPGQIWRVVIALLTVFAAVAVFSYNLGAGRLFPTADDRSTTIGVRS